MYSRHFLSVLCLMLLAIGDAGAAARGPDSRAGGKTAKSASSQSGDWRQDLETWLARLQGNFTIKLDIGEKTVCSALGPAGPGATQTCSTRKAQSYASATDCRGVDAGPGLHCTFDGLRQDGGGVDGDGASIRLLSNGLPAHVEFGIDAEARKLTVLITDPNGVRYSAKGTKVGDEVTFKERCELDRSRVAGPCTWTLWIHAKPDGRRIVMTRSSKRGSTELNTLSGLEEPHTFELSRVEQPAPPAQ